MNGGDLGRRPLRSKFGASAVTVGTKAIRVSGITGSRAETDIVPVVNYKHIVFSNERHYTREGVSLLTTKGVFIKNFPDQHQQNGIEKRARTSHRFKKMVRIFKRMRADLPIGLLAPPPVPSFLVECLVYLVEDRYFTVDGEDAYGRVRRVAARIAEILDAPNTSDLLEINGIKYLFRPQQPWTLQGARSFIGRVLARLGDL